MKRFTDGAGWLFADNRCSGGKLEEADLLGCAHCARFVKKKEWENNGGFKAWCCDKPVCDECAKAPPNMECPGSQVAQIERAINDLYRREQNAKVLGI